MLYSISCHHCMDCLLQSGFYYRGIRLDSQRTFLYSHQTYYALKSQYESNNEQKYRKIIHLGIF